MMVLLVFLVSLRFNLYDLQIVVNCVRKVTADRKQRDSPGYFFDWLRRLRAWQNGISTSDDLLYWIQASF